MRKALIALFVIFLTVPSFAGESWLERLKSKLEKIVPVKKAAVTTAVGGVRGAQKDTADTLYWKGKDEEAQVGEEELEKFNIALEAALNGETEKSIEGFERFLKEYPQSPLSEDAKKAVAELKAEK